MHVVYLLEFDERKKAGIKPYAYIGSKSNAVYNDGKIFKENGKLYTTSSQDETLNELLDSDESYSFSVLYSSDDYTATLQAEHDAHVSLDVVADATYFNKSVACVNTYTDPNYATYRHVETGKVARILRTHPKVLAGEWVGVTKGVVLSPEDRAKHSMPGERNSFYGKKHSDETKAISSAKISAYYASDESLEVRQRAAERCRALKGVKKSPEHRRKIGRKGFCMIKNAETGECLRIKSENRSNYDSNIWKNPYSLSTKKWTCTNCGKIGSPPGISRWHNENCRIKQNANH